MTNTDQSDTEKDTTQEYLATQYDPDSYLMLIEDKVSALCTSSPDLH